MANNGRDIISTFRNLHGNAKSCIWTEWMWAVPNTLYAAYATLYMKNLGLSITQIGLISSICLAVQVIASLLSGVLCDKYGRRLTTAVVDSISWGVPIALWCLAQSYAWFIAAALFNGLWRITGVSFGLLMAEDQREDDLVGIFALNQLMSLLSAFFAPISGLCIQRWGLIPTMRVIYGVSFFLYVTKFVLLYFLTKETAIGVQRMRETKGQSMGKMLWDCRKVVWNLLKSKEMLLTMGILIVYNVVQNLNTNFWALIVTDHLGIAEGNVSLFTMLKGFVQILVIFLIVPHISSEKFKRPLLLGWIAFALSQFLVIFTRGGSAIVIPSLILSVALEALALSCMYPVMESLLYINSDPRERSRVLGIIYAVMILVMMFFPSIAGLLSVNNVCAPLYINIALIAIGAALTALLWRIRRKGN